MTRLMYALMTYYEHQFDTRSGRIRGKCPSDHQGLANKGRHRRSLLASELMTRCVVRPRVQK